jgi:membrane protease subunit HflC
VKKIFLTLVVAAALVVGLFLYTVCFTVQAGTSSAVYTLGAITAVRDEPGFYLKWPWPFQSVETVDTRVRMLEVPGKEQQTSDQYSVIASVSVGWRVRNSQKDVVNFLTKMKNEEEARKNIMNRVFGARQSLITETKLTDIVSTESSQREAYEKFEARLQEKVQRELDAAAADYGIEIALLKIKSIALPEEVTQKVTSRMVDERGRISQRLRSDGENEAEKIRNQAKLEREILLSQAEESARRIRGEGDAQAAEHYRLFKKNPELANFLRRLDALKEILKKRSTIVLPADRPLDGLLENPPQVPVRPLDKGEK